MIWRYLVFFMLFCWALLGALHCLLAAPQSLELLANSCALIKCSACGRYIRLQSRCFDAKSWKINKEHDRWWTNGKFKMFEWIPLQFVQPQSGHLQNKSLLKRIKGNKIQATLVKAKGIFANKNWLRILFISTFTWNMLRFSLGNCNFQENSTESVHVQVPLIQYSCGQNNEVAVQKSQDAFYQ